MGVSSSQLQPQELITFKKLPTDVPLNNVMIPERTENRRPTNVKWLIVLGVVVVLLLPFMIYTLSYSDIKRLVRGYDKCGNICGQENYLWSGIGCSGQNFTYKPYLQYENDDFHGGDRFETEFQQRECVQSCRTGYYPLLGRCVKGHKSEFGSSDYSNSDVKIEYEPGSVDLGIYFNSVKWQIVICCLLSILISMGMLFLFRYAVAFVVWGILIGCFTGLVILVGYLWYLYTSMNKQDKNAIQAVAITFTIVAIVLGIILIWCRKKIRLVILLLKETTKAVFDMPVLITIPVICVAVILFLTSLFILTSMYMATAGSLNRAYSDYYTYVGNPVMTFTIFYNIVVYLWLSQFFTGIQYMIIAGAVSKWYFSRDKSHSESPIRTAITNAFRFHLGTVALGALIITLVQLIKAAILGLIKNEKVRVLVQHCLEPIETFFKFLSKNAYIVTALHGQAFIKSGKRAAKLILQNVNDIIAVNYIGDFVLGMAKFLIVVVTLLLSVGIFAIAPGTIPDNNIFAYIIIAVISVVVACVAFGVFETTIDTLFICYCEDNLLNDGMARPYFMSRNLMEFVQSSKEVYGKK